MSTENLETPVVAPVAQVKPMLSMASLNATKQCENEFTFPFVNENGEETSFMITVIGDQASSIKQAIYKKINRERTQDAIIAKRGKDVPVKPVENLINDGNEGVAACIVGWSGIQESYTPELAVELVANNKLIFDQVQAASANLANFTVSK